MKVGALKQHGYFRIYRRTFHFTMNLPGIHTHRKTGVRKWIISLTLMVGIVLPTTETEAQSSRLTGISMHYGYGGIWYLNTIDPVHNLKIHISHGRRTSNNSISLKTGYESLEETRIIPILAQFEHYFGRHGISLDLGYGLAMNRSLEEQSGTDVDGGTAVSARYQYRLSKTDHPELLFSLGYSYRYTEIENSANQISAEQHYHHIETGLGFRF